MNYPDHPSSRFFERFTLIFHSLLVAAFLVWGIFWAVDEHQKFVDGQIAREFVCDGMPEEER